MQRHKVSHTHTYVSQFNLIPLIVFANQIVHFVQNSRIIRWYYARGCPFSPITPLLPLLPPSRYSVMVTNAGYFARRLEAVDPAKLKMITGVRGAAYESWLLALREASTSRRTSGAFRVSSLKWARKHLGNRAVLRSYFDKEARWRRNMSGINSAWGSGLLCRIFEISLVRVINE